MQKIKDILPEYRPDEKFLRYGPKALTDEELLAIILRTGSRELASVDLARRILTPYGDQHTSIINIFNYAFPELQKIKGVGRVKALQIKAVAELSLRIAQSQARHSLVFQDPATVAQYYMEQLRHEKREQVLLLLLDNSCGLIHELTISSGTVNASILSARDIFIHALKYEAVWVLLLHNHPSGNPRPSTADRQFTSEIRQAGKLIGIELLDHIIIGDNCFYSFKEREFLNE